MPSSGAEVSPVVKGLYAFCMPRGSFRRPRPGRGRQDRVKACQEAVNSGRGLRSRDSTGNVIENVIAAALGLALLAYLVYALIRPEKF
jgi:K+-transporting ATPase KdpF subunit